MSMITSVCLNPCVDKTVTIEKFNYGGMNRVVSSRHDYVGKGVNVALNLAALGVSSVCVGLIARNGSEKTFANLEAHNVKHDFWVLPGDIRVNTKVVNLASSVVTELNESWDVSPEIYDSIERLVVRHARDSEWIVLTGSLPRGLGGDTYKRLIRAIRGSANCKIALDAEGEPFALAVAEKPDFVKPNAYELGLYCGQASAIDTPTSAAVHGKALLDIGVEHVIISMGEMGAVYLSKDTALHAQAIPTKVRSTAGAGDAMLAGFIGRVAVGVTAQEAFRFACAAAAAKVATEGTQPITPEVCAALVNRVDVRREFV